MIFSWYLNIPFHFLVPAFCGVIDVPLVVRRLHKSREEVRKDLGVPNDVKLVIFNFGGQPAGWKLKEEYLPASWLCLVCGALDNQELPPNFIKLAKDVYTPDLIAASDCMLGKIGYGTVSEAMAYKLPFIFIRRDYFNEEPYLREMLEYYQGGVEMARRDMLSGCWIPYLERAVNLKLCYEGGTNGGEVWNSQFIFLKISGSSFPPKSLGVKVPIAVLRAEIDNIAPPELLKQYDEALTSQSKVISNNILMKE
ncbi:L-arabinokinase-like [Quercus lobata]|uniref:L-arabinokinase-like n=1 Tax=Quercus lobata TaxID=97700 RepID=UPI0012468AC8|nr:L-arabinokinase-like [Quercus lobata]